MRVPIHRLDVIVQPGRQTPHGQQPEDDAEGHREALLDGAGLVFEVKGDEDGDGHDGHVGCQAEPGEESWVEKSVADLGEGEGCGEGLEERRV